MAEQTYGRLRHSRRKGCPTCDGVDPKSCVRCYGKTRLCDWLNTDIGWAYRPIVSSDGASGTSKGGERG